MLGFADGGSGEASAVTTVVQNAHVGGESVRCVLLQAEFSLEDWKDGNQSSILHILQQLKRPVTVVAKAKDSSERL